MQRYKNGARVKIRIADRKRYARGVADALDGLTGVVTSYNVMSVNGSGFNGGAYLVRLDRAPPKWQTHQRPSRSWWFRPEDLVATA